MSTTWPEDRSRLAWWGVGALLAAVLAYVVHAFIGTFVFGVFLYYATRPVYRRLKRRVKPPSLAAAVSLLVLALPAILLLTYTVAIAIQEYNRLPSDYQFATIERYLQPYLDLSAIPRTPEELLAGNGLSVVTELLNAASQYLGVIATGLLHLFVMIVIAFYLLRDGHRLSRWVRHRFSDDEGVFEVYVAAVDRSFHQVFFGNILNAVFTAVIGAIAYNLLNVFAPAGTAIPYPTLLGLLMGVGSLVPVVGMKLVYFPAAAYLGVVGIVEGPPGMLWLAAAFVVVSFVIVDTIPDLVLRPYVSGRNLHVGMVMLAYIFGPLLFGWYGFLLGPMLLVLVVHFARLVLPELAAGVPIQPMAVDPTHMVGPQVEEPPPTSSEDGTEPPPDVEPADG
jgi:predicted PurR-regulated permease PerM